MGVGVVEIAMLLAVLAVLSLPCLLSLIDALRFTDAEWERAGQNKILWVLLIVIPGLLGSILYLFMVRPGLVRVRHA